MTSSCHKLPSSIHRRLATVQILSFHTFAKLFALSIALLWLTVLNLGGVHSTLAMRQFASFASLGELKNNAVFDSWGNIILRTAVPSSSKMHRNRHSWKS